MLNSLDEWVKEFEIMSKNSNDIIVLSDFLGKMTTGKLELQLLSQSLFTFNEQLFKSQLLIMKKTYDNKFEPNLILSNAWQSAITLSTFISPPLTFIKPSPIPATIFSTPPVIVVDQSLFAIKENLRSNLNNLTNQKTSYEFINCFYKAFLSLIFTVTGINSIIPTPTPLLINSNTI